MHTETWGHVSFAGATPKALEAAEEEYEIMMLYCRFGRPPFMRAHTSLCQLQTTPHDVIFNPNTLRDVEKIFERYLGKPLSQ